MSARRCSRAWTRARSPHDGEGELMARRTHRRRPAIEVVGDHVAEPLTRRDRETLADAVDSYRDGETTRRGFIRTSAAFGLSMTSLSAVLAACGASPHQGSGGNGGGGGQAPQPARRG